MPGDREAFETAIREAANAAWDHEWQAAVQSYEAALAEFPEDANALAGLGLALVEAKQLEQALEVYQRATKLSPDDPLALEKKADVLERMGRLEEAGKQYVAVAEIHLARRNVERAITNWERAASLLPGDVKLRSRLAVAYERTDQVKKAVREYVSLAAIFQRVKDLTKATQALQRALKIDPTNEKVRNNLAALRAGSAVELPDAPDPLQARKEGFEVFMVPPGGEATTLSPVAEAAAKAMGVMAELLFEGDLPEGAQASVARAIEQHRAGDPAQAAASYERAMKSGLEDPAAWLGLGMVYHQLGEADKARAALAHVLDEPDYAIAANLVQGQLYQTSGEWAAAMRYLVEALRYADLATTPEQQDATNASYEAMVEELADEDEDKLREMGQVLVELLEPGDWQKRLLDMRSRLAGGDEATGLLQMLMEPGAEQVTRVVETVDEYIGQGMLLLAMEEAHYAVELSPWYLPVHMRMAEILTKEGKLPQAAEKYNTIASTFLAREEREKAADMYAAVLRMDPMDLPARRRVIEMLIEQERMPDALQHYEEMAEVYLMMADAENARKAYLEAVALAEPSGGYPEQVVRLLHQVGDLDSQRLDWRQALRSYERIIELSPGDEKANMATVDLHFRLADEARAIEQLDGYLGYCISNDRLDRVVPVLEEQVRNRPDDILLRKRLTKVYQEQKRLPEAIAQMDALGELLLEAGKHEEATETIRHIVELNPPDVDGYRQLLQQLEGTDS